MSQISIIVPVFNVKQYLPKCINSILQQTFQDFELLLIDDGSTDGSDVVCDDYAQKDDRIKVIHKKNEGVSIARNIGIKQACSEWITFIDSDDWIEENYLEMFFSIGKRISPTTYISQGILFDYESEKTNEYFFHYDTIFAEKQDFARIIPLYKILHNGCPYGKLLNKKILTENNIYFKPNISTHEDHIFILTYLLFIDKIQLLANTKYHYMKRSTITLSNKKHPSEIHIKVSNIIYNLLIKIKETYGIQDSIYLNKVIEQFCLYELIIGMLRTNSHNRKQICKEARKQIKRLSHFHQFNVRGRSNQIVYHLCTSSLPTALIILCILIMQQTRKGFYN